MCRNNLKSIFLVVFILSLFADCSFAGVAASNSKPQKIEKTSCLKEIAIMTGYAQGKLEELDRYKLIPLSVRFGFDLDPFLAKFNLKPKGITEIIWEPFVNSVIAPNSNIETGLNWLLKYAYPLTEKFYPYFAAGVGIVYMSQHTREQGTQFNFTEQVEGGLSYFLKKNLALNVGYRFRHLSNSSMKQPNDGINTNSVLCGVSFFF